MKRFLPLLALLVTASDLSAQAVESKSYQAMLKTLLSHTVPERSVSEIADDTNIVWLDARELNEYQVSQIENAQWVGYNDFSLSRVENINKDDEVIVYCSVGYRSEKVAEKLMKAGYSNVSNLYGGIFEWKNQGNQVVDSTSTTTEKVHAYDRMWGIWLKKGKKVFD